MTNTQKVDLRLSAVRERLNEIAGLEGDDFTTEIKAEAGTLQAEYSDLEIRHRAAIIAEPPETVTEGAEDGEAVELRAIRGRVHLADYAAAAKSGRGVSGAASEYNEALKMGAEKFPLRLLAPEVEVRATTDADGAKVQGDWLDRVFSRTAAADLGVTFKAVAPGAASYPVVTAGATPAQRGREQDAADAAWTVSATTIEPTGNRSRLKFSRIDALRLPGLEDAFGRELRQGMVEKIDRTIFIGDSGANENDQDITGFQGSGITEFTLTQAAKNNGQTTLFRFLTQCDGRYARGVSDLRVVASIPSYQLWESQIHLAAVSPETIAQFMRGAGMSWTTRGNLASNTSANAFGAYVGLGRGIEGAAVAAIWEDAELIRDPYSDAASGTVALTLHTSWGFAITRENNFKRLKYVA